MDDVLQRLIDRLEAYIGGLIDVASMDELDKANLKAHLVAAEEILLRNGNVKLHQVVSGIAGAILGRLQ
jgi:hypothetical protein